MPVQPGPCCSCSGGGGGGSAPGVSLTLAAAIALRDGGTLVPGTSYTITDGPTIGVAGHTSATEVTVLAVAIDTLSLHAHVLTTFDDSAWVGLFDVDLGAGTLTKLEDNTGNVVSDGLNGALVQTEFPWGFANVYSNVVTNSDLTATRVILTGWGLAATALVKIADNEIHGGEAFPAALGGGGLTTIVDITGLTGATTIFTGNTIRGARLQATGVFPVGAGIYNNEVRSGFRLLIAPTGVTALFIVSGNVFYDHALGSAVNDMEITTDASATFLMAGSSFQGGAFATQYLIGGSTSTIQIADSNFRGDNAAIVLDPASTTDLTFTSVEDVNGAYQVEGTGGLISLTSCNLNNLTLIRNAGATGSITLVKSTIANGALGLAAVSTGNIVFTGSTLSGASSINNTLASGSIEVTNSTMADSSSITGVVTATRGLVVNLCNLSLGTISQERSVDTSIDTVQFSTIRNSLLTLAGLAGDPGDQTAVSRADLSANATVTITDQVAGPAIQDTLVSGLSVLNVDTGGSVASSEFGAGATYNTGAFASSSVLVKGALVKTATAPNTGTYAGFGADTIV